MGCSEQNNEINSFVPKCWEFLAQIPAISENYATA